MKITISRPGMITITVDDVEGAVQLLERLAEQDRKTAATRAEPKPVTRGAAQAEWVRAWTPELFKRFVLSLGDVPATALTFLTKGGTVSDEDLIGALGVESSQALAGVLSAISRRAASMMIPPRAVFSPRNYRKGGKRSNAYAISESFAKMAKEMNWPSDEWTWPGGRHVAEPVER